MSDTEEKKHPASQRKLEKQREEGSIASCQELSGLIATAVGLLSLAALSLVIWSWLSANILVTAQMLQLPLEQSMNVSVDTFIGTMLRSILPVVVATLVASTLTSLIYNRGFLFTIKSVSPKLSRVSPTEGFKRIFGSRGWIEAAMQLVRLAVWLFFCGLVIVLLLPALIRSPHCELSCVGLHIRQVASQLVLGAASFMVVFAVIDMLVQKHLFLNEQRMTDTELKRERKDASMSGEVRRERGRLQHEAAHEGPPLKLTDTTMAFTFGENTVALCYAPPDHRVPRIVAKTLNQVGSKTLRADLGKLQIPIHENEIIVRAAISRDQGGILGQEAFQEFASYLRDAASNDT